MDATGEASRAAPTGELAASRHRAVAELRQQIIDGTLQPGDRVVERTVAEQLQLSRSPVREAVQALIYEGFLVAESPRRIVVRRLSRRDVEELYDVREGLETMATVLATRNATHEDAQQLRHLLAEIAEETDEVALHRLNADFHELMTRLAGNGLLRSLTHPLTGRLQWLYQQNSDWDRLLTEHRAIADAVLSRDEDKARSLAAEHARASRADTLGKLFPDEA
ncbi:GntR family transcriptional regulator [Pseudonocardia ailaonensis]|uniref:GntR family transcriptional regulator n=1 Tax=Pseudonocardia ailaonensis TaxID=367279 RepID=A0ABN2NNM8_9PSEU